MVYATEKSELEKGQEVLVGIRIHFRQDGQKMPSLAKQ